MEQRVADAPKVCAYRAMSSVCLIVLMFAMSGAFDAAAGLPAGWQPDAIAKQNTIKLRTTAREEGEHWFPVWVVVLDEQVYVRLGSRAATRAEQNTTAPYLGVEVNGQKFAKVRGVPAPESAERVAAAMAAKYWSDIFVRYMSHPLTLRLVPEDEEGSH